MKTAAPAKRRLEKQPAAKGLSAKLKLKDAELANLQAKLTERESELRALQEAQSAQDDSKAELENQLRVARDALKPFKEKTKDWDWPPLGAQVAQKLTFGDIKAAADAATQIGEAKSDAVKLGRA